MKAVGRGWVSRTSETVKGDSSFEGGLYAQTMKNSIRMRVPCLRVGNDRERETIYSRQPVVVTASSLNPLATGLSPFQMILLWLPKSM
jgi:hypothetical protein